MARFVRLARLLLLTRRMPPMTGGVILVGENKQWHLAALDTNDRHNEHALRAACGNKCGNRLATWRGASCRHRQLRQHQILAAMSPAPAGGRAVVVRLTLEIDCGNFSHVCHLRWRRAVHCIVRMLSTEPKARETSPKSRRATADDGGG